MTLKISNLQLGKLNGLYYENYISELVAYYAENSPRFVSYIGLKKLRLLLDESFSVAKECGFTLKGPAAFYISLLINFGDGFREDPQYYWLDNILSKNIHMEEFERSLVTSYQVDRYYIYTHGDNHLNNMMKYKDINFDEVLINDENFDSLAHLLLQTIFYQKYNIVGKDALSILINQGKLKAFYIFNFTQPKHKLLVIVVMFIFGHSFDVNPYYSWTEWKRNNVILDKNSLSTDNRGVLAKNLEIWSKEIIDFHI